MEPPPGRAAADGRVRARGAAAPAVRVRGDRPRPARGALAWGVHALLAILALAAPACSLAAPDRSKAAKGSPGITAERTSAGRTAPAPAGSKDPARAYGTEAFPCPPELAPRVRFWVDVFTRYSKDQRVLHDARYPWVIYEVLEVPGWTQPQIKALLDERKAHYAAVLDRLAKEPVAHRTPEDRRVAALLDSVPSGARYTTAKERIRSQPGIREQFRLGLQRSGRYLPVMDALFDSLAIPRELAFLPHVESSFHPGAVSKVGATGLWQFMPATGRRYLRVTTDLDERLDPLRATEAAARYLMEAKRTLGTWPQAVVSYNHGVAGVLRAQKSTGSTDIARILLEYDGPGFGFASQNFYCEFLAAIEVARHPQEYFDGEIVPDLPLVASEYTLPDFVHWPTLVRAFRTTSEVLAELNPAVGPSYHSGRRPLPRGYVLRLPARQPSEVAALYAAIPAAERFDRIPVPETYRVKRGDTLGSIARRHHVSLTALLRANHLKKSSVIRPGQRLVLPQGARGQL